MRRAKKGPETIWDKVKKFDEDFAVGVNGMTDESLKGRLVVIADEDEQTEKARELDPDLPSLREQLKTAGETYSVPLKKNKLRRKLILQTLKERGKL